MAEKSKSPPADEAAPAPVDTVHGSAAIYDAETRPIVTTATEVALGQSDEIEARPPPTMTPSQRLAVLVAQTRLRSAQSTAESGSQRAIQLAMEDPKVSLAPVVSPVLSGAPAAVTTPEVAAVPQGVEEGEATEKEEAPHELVVARGESAAITPGVEEPAEPLIDRVPRTRVLAVLGSGRGLRVGLAAVLAGGLAWLALAWIVPRFRETRAPQAPEPGVHAPSSSSTAVDLPPRKPSTRPTEAPSPAAPAMAPAAPAAQGTAERASEPGAYAPPVRAEEEDLSPDRPQGASAKRKRDSARAQPGQVRPSSTRAAHTRAKTKAGARSASPSKNDPDDVLPLLTR